MSLVGTTATWVLGLAALAGILVTHLHFARVRRRRAAVPQEVRGTPSKGSSDSGDSGGGIIFADGPDRHGDQGSHDRLQLDPSHSDGHRNHHPGPPQDGWNGSDSGGSSDGGGGGGGD